jgi:uncharacterized protein
MEASSAARDPRGPRAAPAPAPDPVADLAPLDSRVRRLWWAQAALIVLQATAAAVLVDLLLPLPLPGGVLPAAVFTVGAVLAAVVPPLRYRRWRFAVRDQDLWIRQGVLWVTVSVIPFDRLQFVDTRQGPLDRLFGLAQLVVHTAALGTSARLPGLDAGVAENLRERLAQVGSGDGL